MNTLFGTDGIRGLANQYPMNAELAFIWGKPLATIIKKKNKDILLGKDTRISGDMLEAALTAGLRFKGYECTECRYSHYTCSGIPNKVLPC